MLKISGPLSYVLMGLLIAALIYSAFLNFRDHFSTFFPNPPIFTSSLLVPDFKVGENPPIQYNRKIRATFQGLYYVEVKNALTGESACTGNGSSVYSTSDVINPTVDLDWYANKECSIELQAGQYFIETNFIIRTENKSMFYSNISNIFNVLD